jgi:hypothetical protein
MSWSGRAGAEIIVFEIIFINFKYFDSPSFVVIAGPTRKSMNRDEGYVLPIA